METMRDKYTIIFKTRVATREQSVSIVHQVALVIVIGNDHIECNIGTYCSMTVPKEGSIAKERRNKFIKCLMVLPCI